MPGTKGYERMSIFLVVKTDRGSGDIYSLAKYIRKKNYISSLVYISHLIYRLT